MAELNQSYKHEFLKSQLEIQEEALRYINQEIHDNIGQVLSLAKLNLNTLVLVKQHENREAIDNSKQLLGKAISDLRGLSISLNPDRLIELGLEENVRHELEMVTHTLNYNVSLQVKGSVYLIPIKIQTIFFRIVQETIRNIIKHTEANNSQIILDYEPHQFCIVIINNGFNFNLEQIKNNVQVNIALKNIQYRSEIIGAKFLFKSSTEGGVEIRICLPKEK